MCDENAALRSNSSRFGFVSSWYLYCSGLVSAPKTTRSLSANETRVAWARSTHLQLTLECLWATLVTCP